MIILVTGGAGFIGSHIVDRLLQLHHHVFVVDNLSTGRKENINHKATFFQLDICAPELEAVFRERAIDIVIHQAAQPSVTVSLSQPVHDAAINILGTLYLLEMCRKYNVRKIICAQSAAEIGNPQYLPVDEEHSVQPVSPYGLSKHSMGQYLKLYSNLYGLKYTSLRYANVYGPRQNTKGESGVIAHFAGKLVHNEPFTIFGDGTTTRDFVYVQDVVEANILALTKGDNQLFNVGTGVETSVNDIFQKMTAIIGKNIIPQYIPPRAGDIKRSVFNIEKIKKELGWMPRVSLEEGLTHTMNALQ